jgi:hypothetical protein
VLRGEVGANAKRSRVSVDSKRMNAARIVVLSIALGPGGVAASFASGSDVTSASIEPIAQFADGLVAKVDTGLVQAVAPVDDQPPRHSESVSVVRSGIQSSTATQNIAKGRPI